MLAVAWGKLIQRTRVKIYHPWAKHLKHARQTYSNRKFNVYLPFQYYKNILDHWCALWNQKWYYQRKFESRDIHDCQQLSPNMTMRMRIVVSSIMCYVWLEKCLEINYNWQELIYPFAFGLILITMNKKKHIYLIFSFTAKKQNE